MDTTIHQHLLIGLLAWTLVFMTGSLIGLYRQPTDFGKGFWFMSGMWVLVDGAIVLWSMISGPVPTSELLGLLKINSGLDIGYLISGIILWRMKKPLLKGFGIAIIVQAIFLLIFDLYFWFRCSESLKTITA
jgi:hypothetical protein